MTSKKTFLASSFLVILSACSGECSCGTTGNNDDGNGGAGGGSTTGVTAGTGGEGTGGDGTTAGTGGTGGEGTGGAGGEGTGGAGGEGGGGGGDGFCDVLNVDDPATCDVDCDTSVEGATGVFMCTIGCDVAEGCGDPTFVCIPEAEGSDVGVCLFDCAAEACPGVSEYVCDQDLLACIPDGLSD